MALTREQGIELRAVLDDRRQALLGELREDAERLRRDRYGELAGPAPDAGDESVADLIADLGQAGVSRDLAELREVEAARERMTEGSYGVCIECGAEIGYRRLRAYPSAIRCIDCQRRAERATTGERPTL
jgi:RNA polymerase-binding transcription factor DksA